MSDDLVLYTHPMSRGRIARWMLEETGAPYRAEILGYGTSMKDAAFLALNPMGKVPTLRHRGAVVTETAAICAYLADAFPEAGLAPPPAERAAYYRWMFFAAGPMEAALTNTALGVEVPDGKERMVGYGSLPDVLGAVEHALAGGREHVAGDRFSAADVYVGSMLSWGMMFGVFEKRPLFEAYTARLQARPAARRAAEIDDALMADHPTGG